MKANTATLSLFELAHAWHVNPRFIRNFIRFCGLPTDGRYQIRASDALAWLADHDLTVADDGSGLQ